MKKFALILALALSMSAFLHAQDNEPLIVRDADGNITKIAGMTPAAAVAVGIVVFAGIAYAVSQNDDGTFVVTAATATATGTR